MSRVPKPSPGLFYALDTSGGWMIVPRFIGTGEEFAHPDLWAEIVHDLLPQHWDLSPDQVAELLEAPYGCARGRVISPEEHHLDAHKGKWLVLHGGEKEIPREVRYTLLAHFHLLPLKRQVVFIEEEHSHMLPTDRAIVAPILGLEGTEPSCADDLLSPPRGRSSG